MKLLIYYNANYKRFDIRYDQKLRSPRNNDYDKYNRMYIHSVYLFDNKQFCSYEKQEKYFNKLLKKIYKPINKIEYKSKIKKIRKDYEKSWWQI